MEQTAPSKGFIWGSAAASFVVMSYTDAAVIISTAADVNLQLAGPPRRDGAVRAKACVVLSLQSAPLLDIEALGFYSS